MRTPLAWHTFTHNRARALSAIAAVTFCVLLLFMQIGFYASCDVSATLIHRLLHADLVLTSPQYLIVREAGSIPRRRVRQALQDDDVRGAIGVHIGTANWRNVATGVPQDMMLIGVDTDVRPFALPALNEQMRRIQALDTGVMGSFAHKTIGPHAPGTVSELGGRRIRLVGEFDWATGFNALGLLVVNERTFASILGAARLNEVQLVLLRLAPGADPETVAARLAGTLPEDVRVWTSAGLQRYERDYWLNVKPIGLIFLSGVIIALLVGTVVLFQVLASNVAQHQLEYATLRAIGYPSTRVRVVVMQQAALLALLAFPPGALASWGLYAVIREATHLPLSMTADRLLTVLALSVSMCLAAGWIATRRATVVDPAELF